jgi:hypothetical protein
LERAELPVVLPERDAQYFELYNDLALFWYTKPVLAGQHNRITALKNSAVIRFADAFC